MGSELGPFIEWNDESALDWCLEAFLSHQNPKAYVKALNGLYCNFPAFWEQDTSWDGFDWAALDDENHNVISFFRIDKEGNRILAVSNFSNAKYSNYKIIGGGV